MSEIEEIKNYWHFNGESSEINDVVTLREIAITDIHKLAYEVKRLGVTVEELERKLKDLSELIESESYTDHIKCQDVVCITPLLDVIKYETEE